VIFLLKASILALVIMMGGGLLVSLHDVPEASPGGRVHLAFAPGEELNFAVKYGMVRAGDARLAVEGHEVVDGEHAYRLVSTARSSRFFSTFFKVDDRIESLWSIEQKLPLRFERHIREGNYSKDETIDFNHQKGVAVYGNSEEKEILPGAQDVLSAFYFVRNHQLVPGDTVTVPNHSGGENYPLEVVVIRKERIKVEAGEFSCIVLEPLLKTAGLFKQEGSLTIWMTDDSRHMPVLMKSKVAVGSIVAELESFRMGRPPKLSGESGEEGQTAMGNRAQ
jgi:hypothetical protein